MSRILEASRRLPVQYKGYKRSHNLLWPWTVQIDTSQEILLFYFSFVLCSPCSHTHQLPSWTTFAQSHLAFHLSPPSLHVSSSQYVQRDDVLYVLTPNPFSIFLAQPTLFTTFPLSLFSLLIVPMVCVWLTDRQTRTTSIPAESAKRMNKIQTTPQPSATENEEYTHHTIVETPRFELPWMTKLREGVVSPTMTSLSLNDGHANASKTNVQRRVSAPGLLRLNRFCKSQSSAVTARVPESTLHR